MPDSLRRSSKIVRAGEGGIESTRLMGMEPVIGLAKAEEAAEFARDRRSSGKISPSAPLEDRLFFHRADMVEMCELMRETPLNDALSEPERLFFGDGAVSMPVSLRS
ncbi:MAG: hypothetical protein LBE67_05990 [Kocuria palustris]|nr:hypothetical protein [Kocuria palustris]